MRTTVALALLLLALGAAACGCRRGPDGDALRDHLQASLDRDYDEGLLRVVTVSRKGVYPYRVAGDETPHVLVYYDARLAFARDHQLTDWETIGVGSLLGVLGATPRGVAGIDPGGNRADDELSVYGALPFERDGDAWRLSDDPPPGEEPAGEMTGSSDADADLTPRQRRLHRLERVGATLDLRGSGAADAFDAELDRFTALQECRLAVEEGRPALATGLPFGDYAALGEALGSILERGGGPACLLPTTGSAENVRRVAAGDVVFGLAQGDVAAMAYGGTGLFEGQVPLRQLRAVAALYPEAVQILTASDAGIDTVDQLRGRRVDLGPAGSGSRVSALRVLDAAGLGAADLAQIAGRPTSDALEALGAGRVDAVFVTVAWPQATLSERFSKDRLRLVSLSKDQVAALTAGDPALVPVTIPAHSYPGQDAPCRTVAVTSLLVTRADAGEDQVAAAIEALFDHVDALGEALGHAWVASPDTARRGASIPLHPAAERYLAP